MERTVPPRLLALAVLTAVCAAPASAQNLPNSGSQGMPGGLGAAASQAAQALGSAAKDKMMIKDLLGAQVTGPGGQVIGTVDNLAVVPGGRIVAALISTKDKNTGRLAVPFAAAKLSATAGKMGLQLPMTLSELQSNKDIQALTQTVTGMAGGSP